MKNRNGFTLVELIAVIAILCIILLTAVPNIINNINDKKSTSTKIVYDLIKTAAKNYEIDLNINEKKIIPISTLCERYISCPIIDPSTNEEIDGFISIGEDEYEFLRAIHLDVKPNGGTLSQEFEKSYIEGTEITLLNPVKGDCKFVSWQVVKGNSSINDNDSILTIGNTDTIIYAIWEDIVSFDIDLKGGTSSQSFESSYRTGTDLILNPPTREGYTFAGWEVDSGNSILSGNKLTIGIENTKISAKWTGNTYMITYKLDGGDPGSLAPTSGTYGSTVTVSNPTKKGYTFNGWTITKGATEGATISDTNLTIGLSDIELTANWEINTYAISYNLNGGTAGSSAPTSGTYGSTVTVSNPTKAGVKFNGWTITEGETEGAILSETNLTIGAGNIELTANWKFDPTYDPTCTMHDKTEGLDITVKFPSGLIPVTIDSSGNVMTVAPNDDLWYNYSCKKWANAILVTESSRSKYLNKYYVSVTSSDILAYFVYIPRFSYKIFEFTNAPTNVEVTFVSSSTKNTGTTVGTMRTHPGFTFGTQELSGIWFGKYETSGTATVPTILPNATSLQDQKLYDKFLTSLKFAGGTLSSGVVTFAGSSAYGLGSDVDTHVVKDSEFSAVEYLGASKYGIGGPLTVAQPLPHNTSGIYQLNTGEIENVMTLFGGSINTDSSGFKYYDSSTKRLDSKYLTVLPSSQTTNVKTCGIACWELGLFKNSEGDTKYDYVNTYSPWGWRGGEFYYNRTDGSASLSLRVVLVYQ